MIYDIKLRKTYCRGILTVTFMLALILSLSNILYVPVFGESSADLKGVIVEGGVMSPSFDKDTLKYKVRVSQSNTEVKLNPIPVDPSATVEVTGDSTVDLKIGKTAKAIINVKSADGTTTKSYSFYVTRYDYEVTPSPELTKDPNSTPESTPTIENENAEETDVNAKDNESTPEKTEEPTKANNRPASSNGDDDDRVIPRSDVAFLIVLGFLSGIIIGYAVFYFSKRT